MIKFKKIINKKNKSKMLKSNESPWGIVSVKKGRPIPQKLKKLKLLEFLKIFYSLATARST